MFWIFIALLNPLFHSGACLVDSLLANKRLSSIWAVVFYVSLFNLLLIPITVLLDTPQTTTLTNTLLILLLGCTNFLYLFPYYRSLQHADTSIVASLFSLSQLFIPFFAYLFVGESLTTQQYAGFAIIVLASFLLTYDPRQARFNRSLMYMSISSIAVVAEAIIFKYLFEHGVNWGTAVAGQSFSAFLWTLPLLLVSTTSVRIRKEWRLFRSSLPLFALGEVLTFAGTAAGTYAISLTPLTFEKSVESFQPLFILGIALIFKWKYPDFFREAVDGGSLKKKLFFFLIMLIGALFMAW